METGTSPPAPAPAPAPASAPLPRNSSIITSPTVTRHSTINTSTSTSPSNEMVIIQLSMELSPLSPPINTSPAIPSNTLFPPPTTLIHSQSVPTTPTNAGINNEHKESTSTSTPPHPFKRQMSDIASTPQHTSLSHGQSMSIPTTPFGIVIVPTHITYATLRQAITTEFTSDVMSTMDTIDEQMKCVISQGTYGFVRRGITLLQSHESFHLVDETSITLRPIAPTPTTASLLSPLTIGSHGQHDALSSSGLLLDSTAHQHRHLTSSHGTVSSSDVMLQHDPMIQEAITHMSHGTTPAVTSPSHPTTAEHTPAGSPSHASMIMNLIRHHSMMPFTTHKHTLPSALHTMMTGEKTNLPIQPMQEPDIGHIPQSHERSISSQQRTLSQQSPPSETITSPHIFSFLQQHQQHEQQTSQQTLHQPYHRPIATKNRPFVGLPSRVELLPDDEDDDFSDTSSPSSSSTSYIESSDDDIDDPIKHIPHSRHSLRITIIGEKESTYDDDITQPGAARGIIRQMDSLEEFLSLPYDGTYADSATPLWIAIENASDAVYESIGHKFGLHPLTVEDCQTKTTREKLEIFQTYLFLVFHAFYNKRNDANVEMVRARLDKSYGNCLENTAWVIHALLDSIVDSLQPVVEGINMQVDALDDLIYILSGNEHRDLLKRMSLIRRRLSFLRQRLWSKKDILTSLIGKDWQSFLNGVQIPYLRDVYDHVVTMLNTVESSSSVLLSLQSTYFANVSIDVSAAATDVNAVMKRMSAMAAIILPLTLVSGIMGMNVNVPFQHDSDNEEQELGAFWFIMGIMLLSVLAVIILFRKKRMI